MAQSNLTPILIVGVVGLGALLLTRRRGGSSWLSSPGVTVSQVLDRIDCRVLFTNRTSALSSFTANVDYFTDRLGQVATDSVAVPPLSPGQSFLVLDVQLFGIPPPIQPGDLLTVRWEVFSTNDPITPLATLNHSADLAILQMTVSRLLKKRQPPKQTIVFLTGY